MGCCQTAPVSEAAAKAEMEEKMPRAKSFSFSDSSKKKNEEDDNRAFNRPLDVVREEAHEERLLADITYFNLPTIFQLRKIFTRISAFKVNDGLIDRSEFASALGVHDSSLLCQCLFRSFDLSRRSQLTFREFVMTLSVLSPNAPQREKIKFAFELFDLNKDGSIDAQELQQLLVSAFEDAHMIAGADTFGLDEQAMQEIVRNTIASVDTDGNGVIDLDEFTKMVEENPSVLAPFSIDVHEILDREFRRIQRMSSQEVSTRGPLSRSRSPVPMHPPRKMSVEYDAAAVAAGDVEEEVVEVVKVVDFGDAQLDALFDRSPVHAPNNEAASSDRPPPNSL